MKKRETEKIKKRKLKKSVKRSLFLMCMLFVAAGGLYFVYQYNSGVSLANDHETQEIETGLSDNSTIYDRYSQFDPFEGADAQFGEINVLLIGNDARGDEEEARSDALMIGHYDQDTKKVKLVSLMRDTYVEVPDYGMQKINAAYSLGGPELVRQTIKHNFDVDVQYYAIVNFEGFSKIVDVIAPDGIDVNIPYEMSHGIGMTLVPGEQSLNGDQVLGYVRFRHDIHSDFGRVERQQEALSKLKDQAMSVNTLLNLPKLMGVIDPYIETNIDSKTLFTIGKGLLAGGKSNEVESLRIPVEGSFTDERVNVGAVLAIDTYTNREALKDFLSTDAQKEEEVVEEKVESTESDEVIYYSGSDD
ncbi:transcriptional regulator [Sporosarcina sp. P13]|uniref:LCP family protein n=1 Tax=Sporosarcina sp. P13 TaxID=2048263 RepID=UPI000C16C2A1|nr:LCP family protein [Sporosarcina sp. P13]PIC63808.1 transcriptional regulator [Sporosarcina sp. P13]